MFSRNPESSQGSTSRVPFWQPSHKLLPELSLGISDMAKTTAPNQQPPDDSLRVLIIDDDRIHAETVAEVLQRIGYVATIATSGTAGVRLLENSDFDVVLTDLRMADLDGLAVLRRAKEEQPDIEVVMITGHGEIKTAVEAIQQGASHYLQKPVDMAELRAIVAKAGEHQRLQRVNRDLRRQLDEKFGFEGVVGNSPKMHDVLARLKAYAPTKATVLILGESGTGKELAAKALHANSPRKAKQFVAMNCTALNENLLDDELFGHEAGAFTGADRLRKGRFEHAHGGTLFLDEIGDMPPALQAKLLRVLENGQVFRIGSNEPIHVDVRLISATHRDLEAAIAEGKFRQDLYFRLKVGLVRLPPLRERREDIPLLIEHFLRDFNARHGKHVVRVAEPLRRAIASYDWPGNVRELRNIIESMVVQDVDGVLSLDDLPDGDSLRNSAGLGDARVGTLDQFAGRPLADIERFHIERTLERTSGNREEAARILGIGERTLYRVIQDWKLQDKIRQALDEANHDVAAAAKALGMKASLLQRKIKKWGWHSDQ
jgi:two-component system, NtrC family, response regulator HydG